MILDTEAAVMANFEFLGQTDVDLDDDDELNDDMDESGDLDDQEEIRSAKRKNKVNKRLKTKFVKLYLYRIFTLCLIMEYYCMLKIRIVIDTLKLCDRFYI